jgi:hypothetical protein
MKRINISQVDAIFANGIYPIEFLIYYKSRLNTKKIRAALKRLTSSFWPVFGEYDTGTIHFDTYREEECFDEEVTNQEFEPKETNTNIFKKYGQIIPSDLKKLFFLKIIQYKNGTVLIPRLNHLAGDGYSYFYFLSALAAMSQTKYVPFKKHIVQALYKPHHRRTILKEFRFNESVERLSPEKGPFTIKFEEISKKEVRTLIKNVASKLNQRISTNDILSAMVVKKTLEIKEEYFGDDFHLSIPIDIRRQIKAYGLRFFGNGIMVNVINFKSEDIIRSDVNKIAIEIRRSMPVITKELFVQFLADIETMITEGQTNKLRPYDPERGCLVTNLSKLPANKLNFGSGDPDFIFPLTVAKNSAIILADQDNFILRFVY